MMRINDDTWLFVSGMMNDMQEEEAKHDKAIQGLMISPESPLVSTYYATQTALISTLSMLVNDDFNSIAWFIFDNEWGSNGLGAVIDDNLQDIDTHDKLRQLIEQ